MEIKPVEEEIVREEANIEDSTLLEFDDQNRQSYHNIRYDFGIQYPAEWKNAVEPPAKDGISFINKENQDIRVYGGYRVEPPDYPINLIDEYKMDGFESSEHSNIEDKKGILLLKTQNNETKMKYYIIGEDMYCCFYAVMDEDYFNKNKDTIIKIARTLYLDEDE